MIMQSRSNRYYWRQRTRRLMSLINALLATIVLLAVLLPSAASAAPACPGGQATPSGCSYQIDADTVCVWPMLVNGQRVAWCIRQGGQP